jgi:hypothetical protein
MALEIHRLVADLSTAQIANFFRERPYATQAGCDQWAAEAVGETVGASFVQGVTSYTVETKGVVVQFCSAEDALDIQSVREAQIAYGPRFVPCPRASETPFGLYAYVMNNVGGSVSILRETSYAPMMAAS